MKAAIPDEAPEPHQGQERLIIGFRTTEGGLYPAWLAPEQGANPEDCHEYDLTLDDDAIDQNKGLEKQSPPVTVKNSKML